MALDEKFPYNPLADERIPASELSLPEQYGQLVRDVAEAQETYYTSTGQSRKNAQLWLETSTIELQFFVNKYGEQPLIPQKPSDSDSAGYETPRWKPPEAAQQELQEQFEALLTDSERARELLEAGRHDDPETIDELRDAKAKADAALADFQLQHINRQAKLI